MYLRRKNHYLILVLYLLFFQIQPTLSQTQKFVFKRLITENGLFQSNVYTIFQDRMGFMWFGTNNGLMKYDGNNSSIYQNNPADSLSIASNFIVDIFEDSYGTFWIGNGFSGLNRFDREKEVFFKYEHNNVNERFISSNNIRDIFQDSKGNLWIGTAGGGLNLYERQSDSFINFTHDQKSDSDIGSNYFSSIAEDKNGYLWFGSQEGIITKYNTETKSGKSYKLFNDTNIDLFNTTFGKLYVDSENNVWFSTQNGLYLFDQKKESFQHFKKGSTNRDLNTNDIASVLEIKNGVYLVATNHGGLNIYDKYSGTFTYQLSSKWDESTINNDQLYTCYRSPDGIIWFGSYHGGINILDINANKFQQYKNLVDPSEFLNCINSVLSVCEDKDKNIWIGNDGQGIDIVDPKTYKITRLTADRSKQNSIKENVVPEIYRDRKDNIWIGTYLGGLSKLEWRTKKIVNYMHDPDNPESIGGNSIWAILEDSEGYIWCGTMGNGLDRYDEKTNAFKHFKNDPDNPLSLSNNDVFKVFQDKSGNIWVGTRNGLCRLDQNTDHFTRFMSGTDLKNGIYGSWIYDIYEDNFRNLWIGTDLGLNLYHHENNTFEHFQIQDGLPSNMVNSISGDKKNNLWISTNKGLCRFNITERRFRNFDIVDGLQSNEFNYTSSLFSSDGKLYFGGRNGLNIFNPDSIKDNDRVPPIYFTKLSIMNVPVIQRQDSSILKKNISYEKSITLTSKQSAVLSFSFASLNYSNPQKNQYAYWLEGFNNDWIYIGNNHEVTYTNLNPGKYLLKVKGSNNDGVWNESGTSLQITILPPWWKTWWFRTLIYISVAALISMAIFIRIVFYRNQQIKLVRLVKERTIQIEEAAIKLEDNREEINSQNEELLLQKDELFRHRNQLELLVEERTKELIEAKNKAEESDRLKSSFLSNLSHEIRTPLNAILGFSSLLGEKDINDSDRVEYEKIVHNNSNTLLDLINDILDISKIESGQLELMTKPLILGDVLLDLIGTFELLVHQQNIRFNKKVQLKATIENELYKAQIITDKLRLKQVLTNLISNAIKFTAKGYIEIGCTKLAGTEMLEFYVKDTGIGIKEEYLEIVFERFRKIEDDTSQLYRGTGLGLAISSQLVTLMGGTMRLTSQFGKGSAFYFTVPLIKSDTTFLPAQSNKPDSAINDFSHYRIIVAEDDISSFSYIERLLKKTKANIFHAKNGREVLNILNQTANIDLILMDIKMPVMNGIDALHEIRNSNLMIPVIAQTAYALANEVEKLKNEGFNDYISKPIDSDDFYIKLNNYLKNFQKQSNTDN